MLFRSKPAGVGRPATPRAGSRRAPRLPVEIPVGAALSPHPWQSNKAAAWSHPLTLTLVANRKRRGNTPIPAHLQIRIPEMGVTQPIPKRIQRRASLFSEPTVADVGPLGIIDRQGLLFRCAEPRRIRTGQVGRARRMSSATCSSVKLGSLKTVFSSSVFFPTTSFIVLFIWRLSSCSWPVLWPEPRC